MIRVRRVPVLIVAAVVAAGVVLSADVKFTQTYKSVDAGAVSFQGKKVATLVMSQDMSLRMSGEEALAREVTARGMQGIGTYRIAPKEELDSAEKARPWFERANVEGVVAVRPVSKDKVVSHTTGMWVGASYNTLWGYYGYGWTEAYIPLKVSHDTVLTVETLVYSVPKNALLWAALSETTNPKNLQKFVGELAKSTVKEMQKNGLAKAIPKK